MQMMKEPQTKTDAELVARFLTDRGASSFEVLYDRHMPYLFRVALRMLDGNQAAAEDALQEAWIRAVTALPKFRGESTLRTWLCGITINCCRETWRCRETASLDRVADSPDSSIGEAGRLDAIRLERALSRLDESGREVVELHDVLGHTHEEVAEILGIAVGTSKSRLFRARETLRAFLRTDVKPAKRSE
jgi:RNA polymerase sigma-70 factor (ECF subfamily)